MFVTILISMANYLTMPQSSTAAVSRGELQSDAIATTLAFNRTIADECTG
jgi:hypothetical protein